MPYAENTAVSIERSRAEIEGILRRYGANGFAYRWMDQGPNRIELIEFLANQKMVRFRLVVPGPEDERYGRTPQGRIRSKPNARHEAWEQSCRQKWRALCLCIKAKLEAVDAEITQFEDEFLAQIVDPETNQTVSELLQPYIAGRLSVSKLLGLPAPTNGQE